MKKIVFLLLAALAMANANAQVKIDPAKVKANAKIKQAPSKTPPAPAPVNKTAAAVTAPLVYKLTSVRVRIKTGNDNKEFPSNVAVWLKTKNTPEGAGYPFIQRALNNEMKINSETEFGLEYHPEYAVESGLAAFQSEGLKLYIRYTPNFFADAWKIEAVTLVLEFKDQFGNLHPALGNKAIAFNNASGFLNNDYRLMECDADGNFSPLTANIRK
jgi:hypothetical protein